MNGLKLEGADPEDPALLDDISGTVNRNELFTGSLSRARNRQ